MTVMRPPPESSAKNSRADAWRCSRSLESAFRIAWRIPIGRSRDGADTSNGIGCAVMCCVAHCQGVSASNGSLPVSSSYDITASE